MKKIDINDPEAQSTDLVAGNIEQLKNLFPELITEGVNGVSVNVDVLKALVGDKSVTEADEKYGLNWHGKRRARQLALTPSTGTLLPCPEESVDWDTTQNLMIEGDNLEVLKLMQKSYSGKIKLIYIDPPYNTGKDFVYPDSFQDNIKNYLELTGQVNFEGRISSNTEASGRFHTDWMNMLYPRLKIAKNLLRQDGTIFISIDDGELPRLRIIADDIFGEENFLACFIWKSRQNKDNRTVTGASIDHEYIVCYGKSIRGAARNLSQYSNSDNDPRGDWTSANMVGIATVDRRPNLHYDLVNPKTGINYGCPDMGWRYEPKTMARLIEEDKILWPSSSDGRPRRKAFISELDSDFTGYSTIVGNGIFTRNGTADIDSLFDTRIFNFPKPVSLISELIEQGSDGNDIVLDFFAGSGTTAHAAMLQNAKDSANRRYITVQLPEPLDPKNREQKTAADFCDKLGKPRTIAELTKERLRRAGIKVKTENPQWQGDTGFRVFKLDNSNIRAWNPIVENLEATLLDYEDHLLKGRSQVDILYELLLKFGLDLCVPIEKRIVAEYEVFSIGGGVLIACLAEQITNSDIESIALGIISWREELATAGDTTCVFRDSAFTDDVAKTNLAAILEQHGIQNVRSL
ncbi:site-specific DNA-methyltransferase [Enterobacter hormaechei]|uniref:site-specific DNA-methyltransferase n=1 Tax=Enterobacter hormaechei TaxID=158836 RepID=UPI0018ED39C2|nr:site-specific DNA-methyltransferase [Enterobacter hormaechei]EKW1335527.1 site-specific DNA-methyltransferase [Enterobacter hormaechei]MBJ6410013.1 site-specific DNA-methyltransferase [Enterobacter hormaechei]MBJ6431148.1 site-specific DNA-methyltransferase [Enterobacter hormaechei]MBJ6589388.1 site-specific DNA-methyltransferase [Enterobacter hormaechei]MBK4246707.1 site-specific DNA-methyltransferase [Enterobacter hormaechei]